MVLASQADLEVAIGWAAVDRGSWRTWTGEDHRFGETAEAMLARATPAPGAHSIVRLAGRMADEVVTGYVEAHLGGVSFQAAMLVRLIVDPRCRRRGVGGMMLDAVLAWLEGAAVVTTSLFVLKENEAARRLYRSRGFQECLGLEHRNALHLVKVNGNGND